MPATFGDEAGPAVTEQSSELTVSAVYDLLSNGRRRFVLKHLLDDSEATVRELSRVAAAWENDVEPDAVTSMQRKRVYTGLHQTHLPRLDDYGVVEYDRDRGEVRATDRIGVFEPYLERQRAEPDDQPRNWPLYYVGVGVATMALVVAVVAEVPPVVTVGPLGTAVIAGASVLVLAAVHAVESGARSRSDDGAGRYLGLGGQPPSGPDR